MFLGRQRRWPSKKSRTSIQLFCSLGTCALDLPGTQQQWIFCFVILPPLPPVTFTEVNNNDPWFFLICRRLRRWPLKKLITSVQLFCPWAPVPLTFTEVEYEFIFDVMSGRLRCWPVQKVNNVQSIILPRATYAADFLASNNNVPWIFLRVSTMWTVILSSSACAFRLLGFLREREGEGRGERAQWRWVCFWISRRLRHWPSKKLRTSVGWFGSQAFAPLIILQVHGRRREGYRDRQSLFVPIFWFFYLLHFRTCYHVFPSSFFSIFFNFCNCYFSSFLLSYLVFFFFWFFDFFLTFYFLPFQISVSEQTKNDKTNPKNGTAQRRKCGTHHYPGGGSTTQLGRGGSTAPPKGWWRKAAQPKRRGETLLPSFCWAVVRSLPRFVPLSFLMVLHSSASFGWRGRPFFQGNEMKWR